MVLTRRGVGPSELGTSSISAELCSPDGCEWMTKKSVFFHGLLSNDVIEKEWAFCVGSLF